MKSFFKKEVSHNSVPKKLTFNFKSVKKRLHFIRAYFLSIWAAASLLPPPPTPYSNFFSICTLRAQGPKNACHA
jgi:hypothetical protein